MNKNLTYYLKIFTQYNLFVSDYIAENNYQVFITQMFLLYNVRSLTTKEISGYGRYDFGFPNPINPYKKEYILINVKVYNKKENKKVIAGKQIENNLKKKCLKAINKIEINECTSRPRNNGYRSFIKYGIAFHKKYCLIAMKIDKGGNKIFLIHLQLQ